MLPGQAPGPFAEPLCGSVPFVSRPILGRKGGAMRRSSESGQVMPLIALALAVLMGFGGMGVDVGYWEYVERQQQSATDAAALGAAQQLARSTCTNWSAATDAADTDAARNGFGSGANVAIAVQTPPR